jgi:Pentapeptide repeats (8 copies)
MLVGTQLQGADLTGAQFQSAGLYETQLQGANLNDSKLTLALIVGPSLWRARGAPCADAQTFDPRFDNSIDFVGQMVEARKPATPEATHKFIDSITARVDDERKGEVARRLQMSLAGDIKPGELAAIEAIWRDCADKSAKAARLDYENQHADFLRDLACNAKNNREEIALGVMRNWLMIPGEVRAGPYQPPSPTRLARGLLSLDGKDCAITSELSERTKDSLRALTVTYSHSPHPTP